MQDEPQDELQDELQHESHYKFFIVFIITADQNIRKIVKNTLNLFLPFICVSVKEFLRHYDPKTLQKFQRHGVGNCTHTLKN